MIATERDVILTVYSYAERLAAEKLILFRLSNFADLKKTVS